MTFTSFDFYIFLSAILILYYILPLKVRWYALLLSNILFYWLISEKSTVNLCMLLGAGVVCWILTSLMEKAEKGKKILLAVDLLIIAIPLLIIKELPLAEHLFDFAAPEWWIVPIGIAFYSLQLISYAVDVYTGRINSEKNILHFVTFVTFFPQIIQGPTPRFIGRFITVALFFKATS